MKKDKLDKLLNDDFDWDKAVVETIGDDNIKSLSQVGVIPYNFNRILLQQSKRDLFYIKLRCM